MTRCVSRAAQDLDHVGNAVPLAPLREPRDAGQELLRLGGAVDRRARLEAVVAGIALAGKDLAEVSQLHGAAAFAGFRVVQHLPQLLARDALLVRQRLEAHRIDLLRDDVLGGADVAGAEIENAARALAVAAGAAGFLVVALERFRQVVVHDPAHVGLVDAHAEGDGGDDHLRVVANERFLVVAARVRIETGVVRQRADAVALQLPGELVDALARQAVDDAGAAIAARVLEQFRVRRAASSAARRSTGWGD